MNTLSKKLVRRLALVTILLPLAGALHGCGYNSLQGLDEDVKASFSEVDNQYKRRADLVPNLVETVKAAAAQERQTLDEVMQARASASQVTINPGDLGNAAAFEKFQKAQGELTSALSRLMVVVEKYPDIKSSEGFRDLQAQLEGTENRIAVARKRYIESVAEYNKAVRYFPTNLTAKFLLHLEPRETFSVSEQERSVPKVDFGTQGK